MDPISQATAGALFAGAGAAASGNRKHIRKALLAGAAAGMVPDLDILIRSAEDPLLSLEYHRHFTHALLFIPVIAFVVAAALHLVRGKKWQIGFGQLYFWCFLGVGSHGLLDACTSYGTQLFLPFTNERVAWDIVSIIDPVLTFSVIGLLLLAACRRASAPITAALAFSFCYLSLGYIQQYRAEQVVEQLAFSRGHTPVRIEAKPTLGNLLVYRVLYETEDAYHVEGIRVGLESIQLWSGEQINKPDFSQLYPWLDPESQTARDIERFRWFAGGFLVVSPTDPNLIIDARYSMSVNTFAPLWGIRVNPDADREDHIKRVSFRNQREGGLEQLWSMIKGEAKGAQFITLK